MSRLKIYQPHSLKRVYDSELTEFLLMLEQKGLKMF